MIAKQIINGKMYNTETAKKCGEFANGGGWRDFSHYEEILYLKKTGEYFLAGEGGPMTKYAERVGQNETSGGSHITPLTIDEAKHWAELHLDADEYVDLFGKPEE